LRACKYARGSKQIDCSRGENVLFDQSFDVGVREVLDDSDKIWESDGSVCVLQDLNCVGISWGYLFAMEVRV
jgi:hypothetical protein